jgi:hypothetical protein
MMEFLGDKRWLVYVLPGFVSLFVASFISDLPKITDAQLPITYIALTFLSVAIPVGVADIYLRQRKQSRSLAEVIQQPIVVSSTFILSIIFGFLLGVFNNTDSVSEGLRSIFGKDKVLTATHTGVLPYLFKKSQLPELANLDGMPYLDRSFKEFRNRYMRFNFGSARDAYEGVATLYSASNEKPQVFLSPVCIIKNGQTTPHIGTGIWLSLDKLESVQVLYNECSPCAAQIETMFGHQPAVCDIKKHMSVQTQVPSKEDAERLGALADALREVATEFDRLRH